MLGSSARNPQSRGLLLNRLGGVRFYVNSHAQLFKKTNPGTPSGVSQIPRDIVTTAHLDTKQPRSIVRQRIDRFQKIIPNQAAEYFLDELQQKVDDPAHIMETYWNYAKREDYPAYTFLVRAFCMLGSNFGPCSFWATADRESLHQAILFKRLVHDLAERPEEVQDLDVVPLLFSMATLEYRCWQLLPALLDKVTERMSDWRCEALCSIIHSLASLNIGCDGPQEQNTFGALDKTDKHYSGLQSRLLLELHDRFSDVDEGSVHDWSQVAWAMVMCEHYSLKGANGEYLLPWALRKACSVVNTEKQLADSGWAQFFIYQCLYSVDVEKPECEVETKKAVPFWMQRHLHLGWLENILLHGQPQGAGDMHKQVSEILKRTNTPALVNCSAGRDQDEQHCWFAGHRIGTDPKTSKGGWVIECDILQPLGPDGRQKVSGWLRLKTRMLREFGLKVVTFHKCHWSKLTTDQRDDQVLKVRALLGYTPLSPQHDVSPVRDQPFDYGEKFWGPKWRPLTWRDPKMFLNRDM